MPPHPTPLHTHTNSTKQEQASQREIMSGGGTTDEDKALAFAILEHLQGNVEGEGVEEAVATLR